ncbi:MAG: Flp family type IVb pilin [Acidobacteria bacterium]|nr:Flp family type IVb pilin [Acidobacteriota bacterium]MBI3657959.1 Flp family type IVb pilin [Acidobacteriota bacterium]
MHEFIRRFWEEEDAQDLVEYALIIALASVTLILAVPSMAAGIKKFIFGAIDALRSAG